MRSKSSILTLLFLLLISCREDKDDVFPTVSINSPAENSNFKVLEQIPIRASISDNEKVESVKVTLSVSSSGKRVLESIDLFPGGSTYNLAENLFISDSLLESGEYLLRVDASDGENTSTAFSSINIQGIKRRSISLILALDRNSSVDIVELDKDQSQTNISSNSDCQDIHINSRFQQLWYSNKMEGTIVAFDLRKLITDFETFPNNTATPDPIFDVQLAGDRFFVSTANSSMQAFNPSFQDIFTYQSSPTFGVRQIYPLGDRVIGRESDIQGNNQLLLYFFNNGAVDSRSSVNYDVIGFGARETDPSMAFLMINSGNDMEVREYNLNNGSSTFLFKRNGINFNSLLQINEYEYLLISDSEVYQFNVSTNFFRAVRSNLTNPTVAFDEVDEIVYIASNNDLFAIDYNTRSVLFTSSMSSPIIDLAVRYNK